MPHNNNLCTHTTPYLVMFMAPPMVYPEMLEGETTLVLSWTTFSETEFLDDHFLTLK